MNKKSLFLVSTFLIFCNNNCTQNTIAPFDEVNLIASSQIDPKFSPDGKKIVFKGSYDSLYAIHFIDISGNYLGNILSNKGFLSSPSWSPDGEHLAISIEGNICTVKTNGDSLMEQKIFLLIGRLMVGT